MALQDNELPRPNNNRGKSGEGMAPDDTTFLEVPMGNTVCDHYLVFTESDPNSNMVSVVCNRCSIHGASYDPTTHTLEDGKIIAKESNG